MVHFQHSRVIIYSGRVSFIIANDNFPFCQHSKKCQPEQSLTKRLLCDDFCSHLSIMATIFHQPKLFWRVIIWIYLQLGIGGTQTGTSRFIGLTLYRVSYADSVIHEIRHCPCGVRNHFDIGKHILLPAFVP